MAKPRIEEMRIRPGKDGSHHVTHTFGSRPRLAKGALTGGMMLDRPPEQEYNFGPQQHGSLLKHIASALALKGMPGAPAPATAAAQSPDEEEPGAEA